MGQNGRLYVTCHGTCAPNNHNCSGEAEQFSDQEDGEPMLGHVGSLLLDHAVISVCPLSVMRLRQLSEVQCAHASVSMGT